MANNEDPDKMPPNSILSGSPLFAKTKLIFRERNIYIKKLTCNLSIYTTEHPDITVSNFMENSTGLKQKGEHTTLCICDICHFSRGA